MAKPKKTIDPSILTSSSDSSIDGLLADIPELKEVGSNKNLIFVPLSQVIPKQIYSRHIIPLDIKKRFFLGELNCYQAISEFKEISESNLQYQRELESLRKLGISMISFGQINPVTGFWKTTNQGMKHFILETGTRRFWALVLAQVEANNGVDLQIEAFDEEKADPTRAFEENNQREKMSAAEIGIAVASIILHNEGIFADQANDTEYEFLRKVFDFEFFSEENLKSFQMNFSLSEEDIKSYIQLLKLSEELLFKSSQNNLSLETLTEILSLPNNQQADAINLKINEPEPGFDLAKEKQPEEIQIVPELESISLLETMSNQIYEWLKLANQEYESGDFKELAEILSSRFEDSSDFETLARRLMNLSRDVRVANTHRRQY